MTETRTLWLETVWEDAFGAMNTRLSTFKYLQDECKSSNNPNPQNRTFTLQ
jgi:hypothetical protein